MRDFAINFAHPYLLFLLIPAVILLVVAILRVPRKYRNTRNRVVSVVLESIVFLCAILVLSGMTFSYTTANTQNEILLLVDVTDTMESCATERDAYVEDLLYQGEDEGCRVGVVTFGFTQVYAAPLSTDAGKVYNEYLTCSDLPDTSATDLSSAMQYAAKLFTNPETSKMVIVSDGKETDQSAVSALSIVTSQGTIVESVYVPSGYEGSDIQIVDVDMPDYHISTGDTFEVSLDIQSSYEGDISLIVTDNGEQMNLLDDDGDVEDGGRNLHEGGNTVTFRCRVYDKYLHAIRITITGVDEEILTQNNTFCVYIYIDDYNKILIFEPEAGQSEELCETLMGKTGEDVEEGEDPYQIVTITLSDWDDADFPLTVDELRQFDLVILNNTSNTDMYDAYYEYLNRIDKYGDYISYFETSSGKKRSGGGLLPQLLYTYVYTYGGGLLTVGGVDENGDANMYSRSDMYGTVLQQMLPVTAINYTPPTGVMVIIDTSGSMNSGEGSLLEIAILGVMQSLDILSTRDYMGIIEFSSQGYVRCPLTSLQYKSTIQEALNHMKDYPMSEGTTLYSSFNTAIELLEASQSLYERKHIIIVTDGDLYDDALCVGLAEECYEKGITVSAVVVGDSYDGLEKMRSICEAADGGSEYVYDGSYLYDCLGSSKENVGNCIYEDIQATIWEEVNYGETLIQVSSSSMLSPLVEGLFAATEENETDWNHLDASLSRFYGTTIKSGASLILTGDYSVPIYAQWSYGEGMVGSYMGDFHKFGDRDDSDLIILDSENGEKFIINVIDNLMPTSDIRPNGITVSLTEDNYTNRLNVYVDVEEGYSIDARIYKCDGDEEIEVLNLGEVTKEDTDYLDCYVTIALDSSNNYSRASFVIKESGVYRIVVSILDSEGEVITNSATGTPSTATIYKEFSYSAEYDNFNSEDDGLDLMNAIAASGLGAAITDADDLVLVFDNLVTRLDRTVDPRLPLIIIALVLFLLGIAVRKFKWKWPHEIARERKVKKNEKK
ncbi:MAG: VWA domain-containing protein [Bacteroidales bacterium]|nr:VWA domain-containing protein [Bacteroidales bacterium]